MSRDSVRPRNVKFVDVTARNDDDEHPAWLRAHRDEAALDTLEYPVSPLSTPEVASHARPALAPLLESVRPPAHPPSQFPRPPSQFPASLSRSAPASVAPPAYPSRLPPPPGSPSQFPSALSTPGGEASGDAATRERRRDTLIEDLVPRAEEEAVLAIKAAIERFAEERARALAEGERELCELVRVICRRVLLREVSLSSSVVEALIQEGLAALGRADRVNVRLGPFFADALEHISENLRHLGIQCTVVIDTHVGAHGCIVETELGRVDESVETRLAVLLSSLDTVP